MKEDLPAPPEIPSLLVSVVGQEIELQQIALRDVLSHLRNYIGETGQNVLKIVRKEVAEHVSESDVQMAILEGTSDLEARMASASSVRTLEELCESSLARLEIVEAKLGKLESKVKAAATSKSKEDSAGASAVAAAAGGGGVVASAGADVQNDLLGMERNIRDLETDLKDAKQANETLTQQVTSVGEQLTSKLDQQQLKLQEGLDLQTKSTDKLRSQLEQLTGERTERKGSSEGVPKQFEELRHECKQLSKEVDDLQSGKASAVALEALVVSVKEFEQSVTKDQQNTNTKLSSMAQLEHRIAPLEAWSQQVTSQLEDLLDTKRKVSADVESLANKAQSLAEAQEFQAKAQLEALDDRCSNLKEEIRAGAGRVTRLEDRHEILSFDQVEGCMKSADDVAVITDKLSLIEEGLKDKEQNVLFSARCLSCNRSYDDVAKMPGGVDLPGEKQQAKVWREIQRALHTPRTDKTEELRVVAVKVGRPTGTKAKDSSNGAGSYASRDPSTWSYGLEDVHLLPCASPRSPGGSVLGASWRTLEYSGTGRRLVEDFLPSASPSTTFLPCAPPTSPSGSGSGPRPQLPGLRAHASRAQTSHGMRRSPEGSACGSLRPGTSSGSFHSPDQSMMSSAGAEAQRDVAAMFSGSGVALYGRPQKRGSQFHSQDTGPLDFQKTLTQLTKR